jgi:hypothetical protein
MFDDSGSAPVKPLATEPVKKPVVVVEEEGSPVLGSQEKSKEASRCIVEIIKTHKK